jgi:hypothetical protein
MCFSCAVSRYKSWGLSCLDQYDKETSSGSRLKKSTTSKDLFAAQAQERSWDFFHNNHDISFYSVADPESGAFLTTGSGARDPGWEKSRFGMNH